jgi:SPP1 family predicted phage head-tail adaptor
MEAGRLRHRVTIQSMTEAQDGTTGAITESWSAGDTTWASIEPLSGREYLAAQEMQSQIMARITIRHRTVTAKMRVLHGSTVYNVHAVLPDKDSGTEYLTLMVSQGVNNG